LKKFFTEKQFGRFIPSYGIRFFQVCEARNCTTGVYFYSTTKYSSGKILFVDKNVKRIRIYPSELPKSRKDKINL